MVTKGTGRGGLESQVQEYGCRKMHLYVNYVDLHTVYYVYTYQNSDRINYTCHVRLHVLRYL